MTESKRDRRSTMDEPLPSLSNELRNITRMMKEIHDMVLDDAKWEKEEISYVDLSGGPRNRIGGVCSGARKTIRWWWCMSLEDFFQNDGSGNLMLVVNLVYLEYFRVVF
ncbi:hypothetical protein CEXT_76591 [Caerostris extrusa]|uniref:Uncharacterized protein n=1 Tax=Caerostris extrusa TaxID=172846 RepID=A0AAV4WI73_CAEEX|nr:hypothetical protein CEXT_76591 [Caerostris extrusa]